MLGEPAGAFLGVYGFQSATESRTSSLILPSNPGGAAGAVPSAASAEGPGSTTGGFTSCAGGMFCAVPPHAVLAQAASPARIIRPTRQARFVSATLIIDSPAVTALKDE